MEEVLYAGDRTRVTRSRQADGRWVVRKRPLGPHASERLGNELAALRCLRGVPGTPRQAPGEAPAGELTLLDAPGTSLAGLPMPWEPTRLAGLAYELAGILAAVHRRGVVHRDVSPANILVGPDGRATLIDYDLAVLPGRDRFDAELPAEQLAGTLPYLAPEQTGRTGRPVDHRADLYALGATLYELLTGAPPFGRDADPLSLVHDHLARVPAPPGGPAGLEAIVLRLLEKEPDRRYQSGEGLAYDLAKLLGDRDPRPLGERDFPLRLAPPSALVGREAPLAALHALFLEAAGGPGVLAFVTGPPGVGKTALANRLRPAVAAAGGRFVCGKFDQIQQDRGRDALGEAFDRLGTLLLAEPDDVVTGLRERLRAAIGPDHRLLATILPAFRALLGVEEDEPVALDEVFPRVRAAALAMLRTVAGPDHPVVLFVDDLQWAPSNAFRLFDDLLDHGVPGLLLLGSFRAEEVDETHPLTPVRERVRRTEIALGNLGGDDLAALVAATLRLTPAEAAPLAAVLGERTGGNPFDTVELLNALRREGVLVPEDTGWAWDAGAVRRFVGDGDVVDLLGARIAALPQRARELVELLSCLGAEASADAVRAASGLGPEEAAAALRPAVDDGLLLVDPAMVRFRHDRVQQAAFARLTPGARSRLSLTVARSLGQAAHYLAGLDALLAPGAAEPGELQRAAGVLRRGAAEARMVANYAAAESYLAAALRLLTPDDEAWAGTRAAHHAALCALGRYAESDRLFAELAAAETDPVRLAGPVAQQIEALVTRRMLAEALGLGLGTLDKLGVDLEDADVAAFHAWLPTAGEPGELSELTDPRLLAAAQLINRLVLAAFFADVTVMARLVGCAASLWAAHGVCAPLAGALGYLGLVTIIGSGDYRAAWTGIRHVLAVCDARGYEPSHVKFMHAVATATWFEPVDASVRTVHEARAGLLRAGDLHNALYTYYTSVTQMADCAGLDALDREVRAALALADRLGAPQERATFAAAERMINAVRAGADQAPDGFDEDAYLAGLAADPMAAAIYLTFRSLSAAVLGDDATLARHSAAAVPLLPAIAGTYMTATTHTLAVLGAQVRAGGPDRAAALTDLEASLAFLAARAADQPGNFRHLHRLAQATRAAVLGDVATAASAYDAAMADAAAVPSWHLPLITERAARFYLDHGLDQVGTLLLAEAVRRYATWGATGKVRALTRAHPVAAPARTVSVHSTELSSADIDLMAVLDAARALSRETDVDALRQRVETVLAQLTGATSVRVILTEDDLAGPLPLSAVRYAERTRVPLLVDDVSRDDRVGRDPYFAGLKHCSLLVVPVLTHGQPTAVLLLENRLSRRAFSTGRLDAVQLIAGQLTVSLENARLYAGLERKVAERTEELNEANHRLEQLTVTDPLTGLPNRRKLDAFLADEWLRALRSGQPIGVLMVDVDSFKAYNDHYGHQGGDECLRLIAEALRDNVRATDLVARYGGEEFCVVMPGTTAQEALGAAGRACRAVAARREPHARATLGIVTVSIGVAAGTPASVAGPEELTKLADEALYDAKRAGRNRVAVSSSL